MNDDIEYWWVGRFKTYERKSSIIFTFKANSYSCLPNKKNTKGKMIFHILLLTNNLNMHTKIREKNNN